MNANLKLREELLHETSLVRRENIKMRNLKLDSNAASVQAAVQDQELRNQVICFPTVDFNKVTF
jgi:hypothetical protein